MDGWMDIQKNATAGVWTARKQWHQQLIQGKDASGKLVRILGFSVVYLFGLTKILQSINSNTYYLRKGPLYLLVCFVRKWFIFYVLIYFLRNNIFIIYFIFNQYVHMIYIISYQKLQFYFKAKKQKSKKSKKGSLSKLRVMSTTTPATQSE